MQDQCMTETERLQKIEEAELRLHRFYEARDRAPAEERAVVEERIRETKAMIEHLKKRLHV